MTFKKTVFLLVGLLITFSSLSQWTKKGSGRYNDKGSFIKADKFGNVFVVGTFCSDTFIFCGKAIKRSSYSNSTADIFIAKLDSIGKLLWVYSLPAATSNGDYSVHAAEIDAKGNLYLCCESNKDTLKFGSFTYVQPSPGSSSLLFVKIDKNGNGVWARTETRMGNGQCGAISADSGGNLYFAGIFHSSSIQIGKTVLSNGSTSTNWPECDIFYGKFDSIGKVAWVKSITGSDGEIAACIKCDNFGHFYITGGFSSRNTTIGKNKLTNYNNSGYNGYDVFFSKFDTSGNNIWAKSYGGSGWYDIGSFIELDKNGHVFFAGRFDSDNFKFGTSTIQNQNSGSLDFFIANVDTSGKTIWAKSFGGEEDDYCSGITTDTIGNVYMAGSFSSDTLKVGKKLLNSVNKVKLNNIFYLKLNPNGKVLWAGSSGGVWNDLGTAITSDPSGNIYLTGHFSSSSITFGKTKIKNFDSLNYDVFITKMLSGCNAFPVANVGKGQTICSGDSVSIGSSPISGNQYIWSSRPSGFVSSLSTAFVSPPKTTTYFLIEIIANTSCLASDSVIIKVNQRPEAKAGLDQGICLGIKTYLGSSPVTGNTYSWTSKPAGFTSTKSFIQIKPNTTTTYYLTEKNTSTGCSKSDSVKVTVSPYPSPPKISSNSSVCEGQEIQLSCNPFAGANYFWTGPNSFSSTLQNPIISNCLMKDSGQYSMNVVVAGCPSLTSYTTVKIKKSPIAIAGNDTTFCYGGMVKLGTKATNGWSYFWSSKPSGFTANISNPAIIPQISRNYFLTVTDSSNNCFRIDSATVKINPVPSAAFIVMPLGTQRTFNFIAIDTIQNSCLWEFGDGNSATGNSVIYTYKIDSEFIVDLSVINNYDCISRSDSNLIVMSGISELGVENKIKINISPNPFTQTTTLGYTLQKQNPVQIQLIDVLGRTISTLANTNQSVGEHSLNFSAPNVGVYFLRIAIGDEVVVKRVVMVR